MGDQRKPLQKASNKSLWIAMNIYELRYICKNLCEFVWIHTDLCELKSFYFSD
jgi:hypothetical protein